MEITVKARQTLLDIALQETGSAEQALQIAIDNNIPVTCKFKGRETLKVSAIEKGRDVLEVYHEKRIIPATAPSIQQETLGGIEYMGIEIDFIVS